MKRIKISNAERQILFNQNEIMKCLELIDETDYEDRKFILEHGIEGEYEKIVHSVIYGTVPCETSEEVERIFELYAVVRESCNAHGLNWKSHPFDFMGFDLQEEGGHITIAPRLMEYGNWSFLKEFPLQSHGSVLHRYRQLLERWQSMGRKREMTVDELNHLFRPYDD